MQLVFKNTFFELILLANGLAILLYYASRKKKKQRAMIFGNYETLEKVAGHDFLKKNDILLVLQLLAMTSFFLAISDPALEREVMAADSDYVLTLDSSATMLKQDYDPSRLEAAKDAAVKFVNEAPNETRIGVVSYSGGLDSKKGLSRDREELKESIENVSLGEEAGSAMANALISSSTMLLESGESRQIILISDGRNNVGSSINESIRVANNQNVTINSIGIGLNRSGERMERMKKVSKRTGGNFTTVNQTTEIKKTMTNMEEDTSQKDLTTHFILFGVIILMLKWGVGTTRYDILP